MEGERVKKQQQQRTEADWTRYATVESQNDARRQRDEPIGTYQHKTRACPDLLTSMFHWFGKTKHGARWPQLPPDLKARFNDMKTRLTSRT